MRIFCHHLIRKDEKETIGLYKNRDVSEKVFRADKSYLGNHCLRVASEEAASHKIFIGFIALIIHYRMYTMLKNKPKERIKKSMKAISDSERNFE